MNGGLGAPTLSSSAFEYGRAVPVEFTCPGAGRSPPLSVSEVPPETETFVLVMDDPDAGSRPYVRWLVWDVPADRTSWPAGVPGGETVDELDGADQGTNSRGPWATWDPARRRTTGRTRFVLYALGSSLGLGPGASRSTVESAIEGTRYGTTRLRGTYDR